MAVDADALTSRDNVKTALNISGTTDDAFIDDLIDRITDKVETYCGRKFKQATYREWHDGARYSTIKVRNWPIISVARIGIGSADALTVRDTSTTDLRATVSVTESSVILKRHDSTGTVATSTIAFTSQASTSLLVTAIDAIGTNWNATLTTNVLSQDLHPIGAEDALGRDVALTYPVDSDVDTRIDYDMGAIEIVDSYWFDRGGWIQADNDIAPWPRPSSRGRRWPTGWRNILVEYDGGYATIPEDLEQIAIELVSQAYHSRSRDTGVQSESIGSYSYTLADQTKIDEQLAARLAQWKEIR